MWPGSAFGKRARRGLRFLFATLSASSADVIAGPIRHVAGGPALLRRVAPPRAAPQRAAAPRVASQRYATTLLPKGTPS